MLIVRFLNLDHQSDGRLDKRPDHGGGRHGGRCDPSYVIAATATAAATAAATATATATAAPPPALPATTILYELLLLLPLREVSDQPRVDGKQ